MKTILFSLFALTLGMFASPAFAIDQVTLTNGTVIQGTVLNDVTNLYVDIRLVNGDTKRIQHSEVQSVDRDVPSKLDRDTMGNQSLGFVSVNLGGAWDTDSTTSGSKVFFDWGVKAGVVTGEFASSKFALALSYDRVSQSFSDAAGDTSTLAYNDLNFQLLFTRISNSGFYIGPNVGVAIFSYSGTGGFLGNSFSSSQTNFEAGMGLGYDAYLSDNFSIGPEVRYEHIFSGNASPGSDTNMIKFALSGAYHF